MSCPTSGVNAVPVSCGARSTTVFATAASATLRLAAGAAAGAVGGGGERGGGGGRRRVGGVLRSQPAGPGHEQRHEIRNRLHTALLVVRPEVVRRGAA